MANITIYDGTAGSIFGNTPFGAYDNDSTFISDGPKVTDWCAKRLGYPIVDIELQDVQFFACFEEAITEYGAQVNRFNIRENLLAAQGNATHTSTGAINSYTHKTITPNLGRLIALSKQYGTEAGSGGLVDWKTGYITTQPSSQEYNLDSLWGAVSESGNAIEIKRVYHQISPAQTRFYDPQFGSNYILNSFGWGNTLAGVHYLAVPVYDDLLKIQHVEFNDRVRKSHYTFELINNKLKIYPIPNTVFRMYFQYIVTNDRDTLATGSAVSDFSNMGYENMLYSNINEPGKQWIRKYTLALIKQLLGSVRSKYSSIPIPNSEVTLDGDSLRAEGAAEAEILISTLREDLEAASRRMLIEKEQEIGEFQQQMLNKAPLKIYTG